MTWFERERGINSTTLDAFGVTISDDGNTAFFNYPSGSRTRTLNGERKFLWNKGAKVSLLMAPVTGKEDKTAYLVEGETDAMRLWQELGGKSYVFCLPGVSTWNPDWATEILKWADNVKVILDNDQDYNVQAQVDFAWKNIKKTLGRKALRVYLPPSIKDVCDFFSLYDIDVFLGMVSNSRKSKYQYLDLSKNPPTQPWLVEGLICLGDVTLVAGDPGLGKSWLTMSLAVAVANGDSNWLNRQLKHSGHVLYIDEENPEDVILRRMRLLGLTDQGMDNVRYLHRQSVWLDKQQEDILEEAIDWEPKLIVVDSLARVHTGDENSASSMAYLFKTGITPLARETGASVLVVHHTVKSETNNSFQRTRGSGDISASVDAAIDVRPTSINGVFTIALYKSRRVLVNDVIPVSIKDVGSDKVVVETTTSGITDMF